MVYSDFAHGIIVNLIADDVIIGTELLIPTTHLMLYMAMVEVRHSTQLKKLA